MQINTYTQGNIRFADNQVSTAGSTTDAQLGIQSAFGPKHAVVTTNDLSDEAVKRAVEQSERIARLAPLNDRALVLEEGDEHNRHEGELSQSDDQPGVA